MFCLLHSFESKFALSCIEAANLLLVFIKFNSISKTDVMGFCDLYFFGLNVYLCVKKLHLPLQLLLLCKHV